MANKKLFLHIGPPKTGSTTIQSLLEAGCAELLKQGVLYPDSGRAHGGESLVLTRQKERTRLSGPLTSHLVLGYTLRGQTEGIDADHCWSALLSEISNSRAKTVLLSAEVFGNLEEEHVRKIRRYLEDYEVRIIAYLREPFALTLSQYTQSVKMGRCHQSLKQFVSLRADHLVNKYSRMIEIWERIFGSRSVIVKDFDRITAGQPGLEIDFLNTIGVDPEPFVPLYANHSTNRSPSPVAIRLMRGTNTVEKLVGMSRTLRPLFDKMRRWILRAFGAREQQGVFSRFLLAPLNSPLFDEHDQRRVEKMADASYSRLARTDAESQDQQTSRDIGNI